MSADMTQLIREHLSKSADVRSAFKKVFSTTGQSTLPFNTIEEYKSVTGKRFRMTPEQMSRNLTRDQAFAEFKENLLKG
jgi:hypothetical protein